MRAESGSACPPVHRAGRLASASRMVLLLLAICAGISAGCDRDNRREPSEEAAAAGVRLRKTDQGWELTRNGGPYFIRGAGGQGSKDLLAKLGGNSVRSWGVENLQEQLDECSRCQLTMCVGIWLGHERHGFDYGDPAQVARQKEKVKEAVLRYKDHPAVLLWGLGNEMEGYGKGDNKAVWKAVNDLALLVKELDPNHPTMTVVAEIGGDRVRSIHDLCPAIDIVGINSYAGAASLAERYRQAGGTKPYILTEFGPPGPWEVGKTAWGAALEPSSSEKALSYRKAYQKAVTGARGLCLGSYAFLWGHKQEATATWFGMLLPGGERLAAADEMASLWSGKKPSNRCPRIERLAVEGPTDVDPGSVVKATLVASDPENDPLTVRWILQADPASYKAGGDREEVPTTFPDSLLRSTSSKAEVRLPSKSGGYRLFAYVYDGQGGAAVANVPLHVKALAKGPAGPAPERPAGK